MLETISIQMKYQCSTVYDIVDNLINSSNCSNLTFLCSISGDGNEFTSFEDRWRKGIDNWNNSCAKKEEIEILYKIGTSLGTTDIEGQISSIELFKEELKPIIVNAETERDKKRNIYRSLGFLSGVLISILTV